MIFNKIDAYTFEEYDEFSLEERTSRNFTLEEFKNSWMSKENSPSIFISARDRINLDELRATLLRMLTQ